MTTNKNIIVNLLMKLIARYGMKVILEGLIEVSSRYHEDYMKQLTKDLTTALRNYEKRKK